ncbi:FAD dependent oxidoreductase [Beauveria brongniartii RCEF 3172]|uniref:FAD dependent oxidoreductase n=1 Tax=Beauveria brongniartii RCEF 3172 TaxID=1081107 RepID=A0A167GEQ5_9HYPO|nr:FAD dependent oxidoreductase [Beauveria brongniartii RCEF 3172]
MTTCSYDIAIIGGGIGGLAAAIALRRAGHHVTVYERRDFCGEVGSSVSCASNGSRFLEEWAVDISKAKPVILRDLTRHDWSTGKILQTYSLGDYREKFGTDYNAFHRIDLHSCLKDTATAEDGEGRPVQLKLWHSAISLNPTGGTVSFDNGSNATHDAIICADGIHSQMRQEMGVIPTVTPSESYCYSCIIPTAKLHDLGLSEFSGSSVHFWGGMGINKIVLGSCSNYEMVTCYCFYPAEKNDLVKDGWDITTTGKALAATFPGLDERLQLLFLHSGNIRMWRLNHHDSYAYWVNGVCCLLGDAAHPMMPDQSQGACMAIEDAGALGILFSPKYASIDIATKLQLYQTVRKPRATRVQESSRRARTDITERIGWSSASDRPGKLTIEELCAVEGNHTTMDKMAAQNLPLWSQLLQSGAYPDFTLVCKAALVQ